jgi:hypothetical protein
MIVGLSTVNGQGPGGGLPGMDKPPNAGPSTAAGDPLRRSVQVWDANHDGVLTCEE